MSRSRIGVILVVLMLAVGLFVASMGVAAGYADPAPEEPAEAVTTDAAEGGSAAPGAPRRIAAPDVVVLFEDFEGAFPPTGWTLVETTGTGNHWARNDDVGAVHRALNYGSGFSAAADPDAVDNGLAWDAELRSPAVALPPETALSFASNFQDFAGNGDAYLYISDDNGSSWTEIFSQSTDDVGGTTGGGVLRVLDLSAYGGETVILRWRYVASDATAWFWHIDDVLLATPSPDFSGSTKRAAEAVEPGGRLTYTINISNGGEADALATRLTDTIPAGTTYVPGSVACTDGSCLYEGGSDTVYWSGGVGVGEIVSVTFAVDVGSLACNALVENEALLSDPDALSTIYTLTHEAEVWTNIVFATEFESDDGGFVADAAGGEWAWGELVPSTDGPPAAHSGTKLWATVLDGNIASEPSEHALTKTVSLPPFFNGVLRWWDWWDGDGSDAARVFVNGTEVYADSSEQHAWEAHTVDLGSYSGQTVEIVFRFEAGGTDAGPAGWYVDDLAVLTCESNPAGELQKTVGAEHGVCSTADSIYVPAGSDVQYCYRFINTGNVTFTRHDLSDSELGLLLDDFSLEMAPEGSATVFPTLATITSSVVNTATWTAYRPGPIDVVSDTATAAVNVMESAPFSTCVGFEDGALPPFFAAETTSSGGANGRVSVTMDFPRSGDYALNLDSDCDDCGGVTRQAAVMMVDVAGQSEAELALWVREHDDEVDPEDGIFISDDGGVTWAEVLSLHDFPSTYEYARVDLAAAAAGAGMDLVDGFLIKFQSAGSATTASDGYSFDDICVQTPQPKIDVTPPALENVLSVDEAATETLTVANVGSVGLTWSIEEAAAGCGGGPSEIPWASVDPAAGATAAGGASAADVTFDAAGLDVGVYTGTLCIASNDIREPLVSVPLTLTVAGVSDLSLAKAAGPDPVVTGAPLTYTLTVYNGGPDAATGVTVSDTLPGGVTLASAPAGCSAADGVVVCAVGALGSGEDAAVTIVVTAPAAAGSVVNTAVVWANEIDPDPENNGAATTTVVVDYRLYLPAIMKR